MIHGFGEPVETEWAYEQTEQAHDQVWARDESKHLRPEWRLVA